MAVIEKAESSAVFGYIFDCFIGSFHSLRGMTCSQDKTLTVTELCPGFVTVIDSGHTWQ